MFYSYFMEYDTDMYALRFEKCDENIVKLSVQNMSLHEDLAQIDYVFCDKTGTLTQNELVFKAF